MDPNVLTSKHHRSVYRCQPSSCSPPVVSQDPAPSPWVVEWYEHGLKGRTYQNPRFRVFRTQHYRNKTLNAVHTDCGVPGTASWVVYELWVSRTALPVDSNKRPDNGLACTPCYRWRSGQKSLLLTFFDRACIWESCPEACNIIYENSRLPSS
jgi:hypothetical protein